MTDSLLKKKCVPCEGGISPLGHDRIKKLMSQVSGWSMGLMIDNGKMIETLQKRFQFKNFREVMAFLREIEEWPKPRGIILIFVSIIIK